MRSFINAILSFLLSRYLSQNMNILQTQPSARVLGRTVEEQFEDDDRVHKMPSNEFHKRTACAGSTEYSGPEGNDPDFNQFTISPMSEPSSPILLSEVSKDSLTYPEADKIEASPRLDPIAHCVTLYDVPNLTLDTSTMITATGTDDLFEPPSTPDLPSESFSPLLRANRLALDADASRKASRFGMTTTTPSTAGKESRPLFGLGIFDISRKEDHSHAFDGLGIVRIQSSPWRGQKSGHGDGEEGDTSLEYSHPISDTFLHDLEAFFLVRDFTPSPSRPLPFSNHCSGDERNGGSTFDVIVEEPTTESNSPSMETATTFAASLRVPAAENSSCHLPSQPSTPANKNLARRIRNALSLTPRRAAKPLSDLCAIVGSSIPSTQTTSSPLTTPAPTSMPTSSSSSSSVHTSGSGSRSAFVRRTCSAFTLSRHDTRSSSRTQRHRGADAMSPSASARHLNVSVSMGPSPGPSPSRIIKSNGVAALGLGDRSLQNHSVRDLSVVGTISSDLKRKLSVSLFRSGSIAS